MADLMDQLYGVPVDKTGNGDHVLIAGETGMGFKLYRIVLTFVVPTAPYVTMRFKSGAADPDAETAPLYVGDMGAIVLDMNPRRWFMTKAAGDPVVLNIAGDAACKVGGFLTVQKLPWPT